jgi:vancomycin resistance protein YoaR
MATKTATKPAPAKAGARAPRQSAPARPAAKVARPAAAPPTTKPTGPKKPSAASLAARQPTKAKLVRDSFTMPQSDFALIAGMKERALSFKRPAKKSELLRAGLHALSALNDAALRAALDALAPLKPGRPKKAG